MISKRPARAVVVQLVSMVLLAGLLASPASAKAPGSSLSGSATPEPDTVSAGALVRFNYQVTNTSSSNFATFYVDATTPDKASGGELIDVVDAYIDPDPGYDPACGPTAAGDLHCDFGGLNSGSTAYVSGIYRVPPDATGSWSVVFTATSNGSTSNDQPGQSHGDDYAVTGTVPIATGDTAGGYIYGDDVTVANTQTLSKKNNPQNAALDFTGSTDSDLPGFGATIREQAANGACAPGITTCFADLTALAINGGEPVPNGFLARIGYFQVPGSAVGGFVHWFGTDTSGDFELIDEACDPTTPVAPCIYGTEKIQGNTFYIIYMKVNGFLRGY